MRVIEESELNILATNIKNLYPNEICWVLDIQDEGFEDFKVWIRKETETVFKITCFNMDNMKVSQLHNEDVKRFLLDNNFGGFTELLEYVINDDIGVRAKDYIRKVKSLNRMLKFFK